MKYSSGAAFRQALEDRLRAISLNNGAPLVRLRKMVAFDRFLARLFWHQSDKWIVKGGFALQLRLGDRARTTKDIDMLVLPQNQMIYPALRQAGILDLGDWFLFDVSDSSGDDRLDHTLKDFGGSRYQIQTLLDGRMFEKFHIDIGVGDPLLDPVEYLEIPAMLAFAGVEPTLVPCYPITQQIAEKLHAYTRPYISGQSTRVKDFVDILLLAELGTFVSERMFRAIEATFNARQTHAIPTSLPPAPKEWSRPYRKMAEEVGLGYEALDKANEAVGQFLNPLLNGKISGKWDPSIWSWTL